MFHKNGNSSSTFKIQKLQFKTKKLQKNWTVRYVKFSGRKNILSIIILGMIANVSPNTKGGRQRLQLWKRKIAIDTKLHRGNVVFNPDNQYALSIGMKFHPYTHGNQKLDLDNFIKPIIDGIAAGLFSNDGENLSQLSKYNQFDDSNFQFIFMERLPDAKAESQEGISVIVSKL